LGEGKSPACTLAGTFTLQYSDAQGVFLEGSTERGRWEASNRLLHFNNPGPSLGVWAFGESLLIETPAMSGIATLEGIDLHSGRALWLYLYPSYAHQTGYKSLSSEAVRLAREELDERAFQARHFPLEYALEKWEPRSWTVVLDPDPQQARKVERTSAVAWAMLCAAVVASLLSSLTPRGAVRTTFAFVVVGAVGILVVAYGHIDGALTIGLWIGFLIAVSMGGAATSRPRSRNVLWCLVLATAGLFAFPPLMSALAR
jgi:hypothetical protein